MKRGLYANALTAIFTVVVTEIVHDTDYYVKYYISKYEDKYTKVFKSKVRLGRKGRMYFMCRGSRIYLDECEKID